MAVVSTSTRHDRHAAPSRSRVIARIATFWLAVLLGPSLLAIFKLLPQLDRTYQAPFGHFWVVTIAAVIAVGLALLMLRVGVVRQDGRVLVISAGLLALSTIFFVHAVATPNVVFARTVHATAWSTPIALLVTAVVLAASTIERLAQQAWIVRRWRWWLGVGAVVWLLYAGFMLVYVPREAAIAAERANADHLNQAYAGNTTSSAAPNGADATMQARMMSIAPFTLPPLYATIICLYVATAVAYGRQYRRSPTRPLFAMAIGALLLAQTALAAYLGPLWHLSFWLYHVLLLAGVLTVAYGILIGYEQTGSLSSTVEGLFLGRTIERQHAAFQHGMTTLLLALEQSDPSRLPQVRNELRQRFALAEDQLDLLQHAVELVAGEREEQRRLQALVAVSRAATLNLDPDALLRDAVQSFAETTDAAICAIGVVDGTTVGFAPQHCRSYLGNITQGVTVPQSALPASFWQERDAVLVGPLSDAFGAFNGGSHPALLLPMRHHDRVLGLLLMQPKAASIDEHVVAICRSIVAHLAGALANAQLHRELRLKHARLQRSEQAREELAQMVVHDLKNPLTSIKGFHTLLTLTSLTPEQHDFVQGAARSAATMTQLVNDMLDLARLEEGRLELQRVETDLADVLSGCRDDLRAWSEDAQKPIVVQIDTPMPPLLIDTGLMRRVVVNLLSNALKHTPRGTQITVRAELHAHAAQITVHDTGPGIAPERLATLFERWSTSGSANREQSNTGLGLSFCKLAVEAHGGTIAVASTPEDGTTFTITLPPG